ncbi:MAG: hypothetical protein Q9221_000626 [Calogaya cf. arnoldii]
MPRKSNVSQAGTGEENTPAKEKADGVNIEDLSLPRTMVQRLAKGVLPPNTQIQKDAIVAMSKGATVFINHIADKANEIALSTNKKTITPLNVLEALSQCEYEDFLPRVKAELDRFNEIATSKRNEYRRKIKEKETGATPNGGEKRNVTVNGDAGNGDVGLDEGEDGEERARKRVRREEGDEGMEKENGQQMKSAGASGTPEEEVDEERYDTAMEDEGAEGEERGEEAAQDDSELSDDEVEEDEPEVSQMELENGLDGRPDELSSGVDEDEDDEEESD